MSLLPWKEHPNRQYCLKYAGLPSWHDGDPMRATPELPSHITTSHIDMYNDCKKGSALAGTKRKIFTPLNIGIGVGSIALIGFGVWFFKFRK